jgi:hypothetical protein
LETCSGGSSILSVGNAVRLIFDFDLHARSHVKGAGVVRKPGVLFPPFFILSRRGAAKDSQLQCALS